MRTKSHLPFKRRYRVSMRPRHRKERNQKALFATILLVLGVFAFVTWRHLKSEAWIFNPSLSSLVPPPKTIEVVGVPDFLKPTILSSLGSLDGWGFNLGRAALTQKFPYLASFRLRRNFFLRKIICVVVLRRVVGLVERRGQLLVYLDDQGVLFKAPNGLYPNSAPQVQLGKGDRDDLRQAAMLIERLENSADLPSPLSGLRYVSPADGWDATLKDGTSISWGDTRWTSEKIKRLGLVLSDARTRFKGNLSVDLRSFEDGKIFISPDGALIGDRRF